MTQPAPTYTESRPLESGHAPVNGIRMYYEMHGRPDGVPLVLLHGGGSTIDVTWGRLLPFLAESRRVLAVEEQGHGRTTDRNAPVAFDTSGEDVAALLRHLKIEQADFFGFSNGASVALEFAIRHPERVRHLVFASSMTRKDGAHPQFWEFMKNADFSNMPQPLKDAFLRVNPDPQQLRTMHDKDAARMKRFEDVPDERVRSVRAPTLIVLGDRDVVKPEHGAELARLIPNARLLILPAGHGDYLGEAVMAPEESRYPELTAWLITRFLDEASMAQTKPDGFLAVPPSGTGRPVLVLHPWWGLNETMKKVCTRLAAQGHVAFAPDLFQGRIARTIAEAESLVGTIERREALAKVSEAAAFLRARAGDDDLAVIGFSFGAFYALEHSITDPGHVGAVVLFYGTRPGADFTASKAAYLGHFAEKDEYEPDSDVEALEAALRKADRPVTFHRYQAGHWFFESDRPDAYNAAAATAAWDRTLAFLRSRPAR